MKDLEKRVSIIEEKLGIVNGTPKLSAGNWYWVDRTKVIPNDKKALVYYQGNNVTTYGFDHLGGVTISYGCHDTFNNYNYRYTLATPKEVEEALVRHAELKYSGKKGKSLHNEYDLILEDVIKWDWDNMSLRYQLKDTYWGCVFCLGEWAEVIEPQQTSLEQDIQQLKDKYNQYKFTITIEDNI